MTLDDAILQEAKAARGKLIEAEHDLERTRADYHYAIRRLHSAGGSLREIADALGLSHQRVHQIVDAGGKVGPWQVPVMPPPLCPPPEALRRRGRGRRGRGFFARFAGEARELVGGAQEQADVLRHTHIGTEHLLLALLEREDDPAAGALRALGVEADATRAAVLERVGEGDAQMPAGQRPFTPRAKKVLELALREALSLGDNYIGTEHILLGMLRDPEGTAAEILLAAGVTAERLREQLDR